ncbi:amidohydrolase family protein [Glutamicibacter nicotianae]
MFLDGVPPAGTGAFIEPYLEGVGFPECHCGSTTMLPEELEGWLMSTALRGISAKIHCTGDASVRLVLDAVQKVREAGLIEPKYHIAHGQFIHPDDLPRFAELAVTADISPSLWFPGGDRRSDETGPSC